MIREYLEMAWSILSHPVADHLLQSTLFAVLAAILVLSLHRNGAQTRYWIWLSASLKFLLPFSLLLGIGSRFSGLLPEREHPRLNAFFDYVSVPIAPVEPLRVSLPVSSERSLAAIVIGIWSIGFAAVMLHWLWRWSRMKAEMRSAKDFPNGIERSTIERLLNKAGVNTPVKIAVASANWGPSVAGFFHPTLLLPEGMSSSLDPAQLEAILAHEVVHILRRDNLMAALQMLVEAVFWFHPLVWWLGAKLMTERESACDEEVLRLGSDPETYAKGILRVCQICLASPLACVSGISGSSLKRRIVNIMSQEKSTRLSRAKKALLASAGFAAFLLPIAVGLAIGPRGFAQPIGMAKKRASFTVASIKPASLDARGISISMGPGGRVVARNVTLRFLIKIAYDLRDDQIGGGPSWLSSKRYDVEAKCEPPISDNLPKQEYQHQVLSRLQSLLADRFQLTLKEGTKEMPVFHLLVAKNGPKIREVPNPPRAKSSSRTSNTHLDATNQDLDWLAHFLGEQVTRPVENRTGLTAHYSFKLDWTPDPSLGVGHDDDTHAEAAIGPSLFTALQEQLGLRLELHKGQAPFMTVERAEPPSDN
jgi:uncharacterized protein (TIGR03435 family)